MVQTNTVVLPGCADAAVLRLKGKRRWLAATLDGNGRYCYLDPYEGGKAAVAEAARNLISTGAVPLAVTDCLNFGNPQDPQIMWQFAQCVQGIADACRAFATPVTGGNVSLYNESPSGPVDPTPVIGMVGIIEGGGPITASFKDAGDVVVLLGETREELGGSAYLAHIYGLKAGLPPRVDLAGERALQRVVCEAARKGWLKSAHDCSDGGLAVALAESCIMDPGRGIGAVIGQTPGSAVPAGNGRSIRPDAWLFGESAGRVIVSCVASELDSLTQLWALHKVPASVLGKVGGERLVIGPWIDARVSDLDAAWRGGLRL
jgi:phosphoribosylformylglycinamidine synthase